MKGIRIEGRVTEGNRIGRQIGYPTANIAAGDGTPAENGVYAAVVEYGGRKYPAMANLGVKPTVSDSRERFLEVHLLGFDGDLYGQRLSAELVEFIRPERKFSSTDELRAQIEKDKQQIENLLKQCI